MRTAVRRAPVTAAIALTAAALAACSAGTLSTTPTGTNGVQQPVSTGGSIAAFSWRMHNRWGTANIPGTGHDTANLYTIPTYPSLNPGFFPVDFDACTISGGVVSWSWSFPDGTTDAPKNCRPTHSLLQGPQQVTLTTTAADGTHGSDVQTVNVKDYLIASLGDSVASGEGNPDSAGNCDVPGPLDILPAPKGDNLRQMFSFCPKVNGQPSYLPSYAQDHQVQVNFDQPTWWPQVPSPPSATADVTDPHITENQSQQCHRSTHAGPARAAYELQNDPAYNRDGTYGVTFLQLACSGASAWDGLLNGYPGLKQKPQGGVFTQLQPQLSDLQTLAAGRSVDAVTLSIGANDIGFSNILTECLKPYMDCTIFTSTGQNFVSEVAKNLKYLSDNLKKVANCLSGGVVSRDVVCPDKDIGEPAGLGIAPSKVYLTTYFDPSQNDNGSPCDYEPLKNVASLYGVSLSSQEFQWANQFVLGPLNATLKAAAAAHGWHLIDVTPDFANHGICAKENWVNKFDEDFSTQGDQFGFFHPTGPGQDEYAKRILEALSANQLPTSSPSATGTTSIPSTTGSTGTTGTTTCGGISIFDYEQGDQCTHIGGLLTADGVQLTVGDLTPGTNDSGKPELCAPVKGINTTSDPKFLTALGFNLESAGPGPGVSVERNGTPVNLQFPIGGTINNVGTLAAGGTGTGTVCFDAGISSGQQVLIIYSPAAQGRSIWVK